MVGRQDGHSLPNRLPGQWIEDVGFEQMQRQALLIKRSIQQTGQHVGPIGRDGGTTDPGVKYAPNTGDGPLDADPSSDRGDQVEAADQRCSQPIDIGDRPNPISCVSELARGDRMLTDHRELRASRLPGGHGTLGPAPEQPRPTGRVADLSRCPVAQCGADRAR